MAAGREWGRTIDESTIFSHIILNYILEIYLRNMHIFYQFLPHFNYLDV